MNVSDAGLSGPVVFEPTVYEDDRGLFFESWNLAKFSLAGISCTFVQDNHSRSKVGALRGLHFQFPNAQGKLVRVTQGKAWDVVVDLRPKSDTFGRSFSVELSAVNRKILWVPEGFAHGFLALEEGTDLLYKCTSFYSPRNEYTLAWNDPALGIDWPLLGTSPLLSQKDAAGLSLGQVKEIMCNQ